MRFLGIGDCNDLATMYKSLAHHRHEDRIIVSDPAYRDVYRGMLELTNDWRQEMAWLGEAKDDGVVIFETADNDARSRLASLLRISGDWRQRTGRPVKG